MNETTKSKLDGKQVLIFYEGLGPQVGGGGVLLGLICRWLIEQQAKVTLVYNGSEKTKRQLPSDLKSIEVQCVRCQRHEYGKLFDPGFLGLEPEPDYYLGISVGGSMAATVASRLSLRFRNMKSMVYCINPYFVRDLDSLGRAALAKNINRPFVKLLTDRSRVFLHQEQIDLLRSMTNNELGGQFCPLPVVFTHKAHPERRPIPFRIVTVTRLSPIKEYVFGLLEAVRRLRLSGMPVTLDIVGDGEFREELTRRTIASGLEDAVRFFGEIPHDRFAEMVAPASVFVGMGTAAIEAAGLRCPVIVAAAYSEEGRTFGTLDQWPLGNMGIDFLKNAKRNIGDELERFFSLNTNEQMAVGEKCFSAAIAYDSNTVLKRLEEIFILSDTIAKPRLVDHLWWYSGMLWHRWKFRKRACSRMKQESVG